MARALFIGRFQPFHNGHLHDIMAILKIYDEIIIAIGSSQEKNTLENPFSYNERKQMIENVLRKNKINNFKIYSIPDLYNDVKWVNYILKNLPKFDALYSGNDWTIRCFRKHNIKAKKLKLINGINSTKIRKLIKENKNWQKFVPKEVFEFIEKIKGAERIKKAYKF